MRKAKQMDLGLVGKTAIVTGAARGLGRCIAQSLAKEGANVVVTDILFPQVKETAQAIKADGGESLATKVDVSNLKDLDKLVKMTVQRFGRIDIIVNNAGICYRDTVEEISEKEWDQVLAVNLKSIFFLYQKVLPYMKRRKFGRIVNLASGAGKIGGVQVGAHYSASKAGVICLTKSMALHGAKYGINVNAICPGVIGTEMVRSASAKQIKKYESMIPLGYIGEPIEVAKAVLFLVSEMGNYITGEITDVNGGFIMD